MTTYELVKRAIQNKQCLTFTFQGYLRKMSPHFIGTKNGTERALFFQYDGKSKSGLNKDRTKNWRCIDLDKIEDIEINSDPFQTARNYTNPPNCINVIDLKVEFTDSKPNQL
jgi:hypothetical protein